MTTYALIVLVVQTLWALDLAVAATVMGDSEFSVFFMISKKWMV